jgi:hypothetical protein
MDNIRSTENPKLVDALARIRHEQVRSWTRHMFIQVNEIQSKKGTIDDLGRQLNALCKDIWEDFDKAQPHVREANINWAENILKVIRGYEVGA